jgi:predicted HD phosphohydrolase
MTASRRTVGFTRMRDGTADDYAFLRTQELEVLRRLPDRLLEALQLLDAPGSIQGYQVSRLGHSLQAATRAERDGADDEMVVAALLHDVGDDLALANHSQFAASIVRPYVRAEVTWVIAMHGLFQMQFYADHYGEDTRGHLRYRDHPWFDSCQRFCERWDEPSFDPAYPSAPLTHFEPRLRAIFGRMPFDPAFVQDPAVP